MQFQYLSSGVSGELAYTVAIERSTVRIVGQKEPAAMSDVFLAGGLGELHVIDADDAHIRPTPPRAV